VGFGAGEFFKVRLTVDMVKGSLNLPGHLQARRRRGAHAVRPFVPGCWGATAAARNTELVRGDLEARFEFLQALHGNLTSSVENFFQLPESVRQKAQ
jgi:hypothetical protein